MKDFKVLILIVVDNGLVPMLWLSPISSPLSLNPYCSGQWSRTCRPIIAKKASPVLILIVVDNGLVPSPSINGCCSHSGVLILIVVDNGLVQVSAWNCQEVNSCLNPYCSGQWSRTVEQNSQICRS